jgi:histone H3/H4
MYHQQPQNQKMEGSKRVQKVLDELSVKYADRKHGAQPIVMEEKAKQMLMDYASELSISVLEAASMLATHRNSKTIDVEDINMILSKLLLYPPHGALDSLCCFFFQKRNWVST